MDWGFTFGPRYASKPFMQAPCLLLNNLLKFFIEKYDYKNVQKSLAKIRHTIGLGQKTFTCSAIPTQNFNTR